MKTTTKTALLSFLTVSTILLAAACQGDPTPSNATWEAPSGRDPNASVTGSVSYRERLALTPGAALVVELRDVSYADAPAPLIARQTISGPGQVPIKFELQYNRQDINPRNTYGLRARIVESDDRLAFTNDTAYDVITRGNPDNVDMLLVLVEPPPDHVDDGAEGSDGRTWVEVPAPIVWANLIPNETENLLRIAYYQSTIEGCVRPGNQELELDGNDIIVRLTLMQPPPTPWSIACNEQVVELDAVEPIRQPLRSGQTYRVIANGQETTSFTLPLLGRRHTVIAESPIELAEVVILESSPPQYQLRVLSALAKGSSCSQFNGYEIRRTDAGRIEVVITYHQIADPVVPFTAVPCTADYPIVETNVPLGSGFEPGVEYTVTVNTDTTTSFVAQ